MASHEPQVCFNLTHKAVIFQPSTAGCAVSWSFRPRASLGSHLVKIRAWSLLPCWRPRGGMNLQKLEGDFCPKTISSMMKTTGRRCQHKYNRVSLESISRLWNYEILSKILKTFHHPPFTILKSQARIAGALGGRVAEQLVFGASQVTTGAGGDLQQVERMARAMVTQFGMSDPGILTLIWV